MKKSIWMFLVVTLVLIGGLLSKATPVYAEEDLEKELSRLKKRIDTLEKRFDIEKARKKYEPSLPSWEDRISLSGVIELETSYEHVDLEAVKDSHTSDIVLATAQLNIDVDIAEYVKGRIVLLYEEDADADRVRLDEGTITLGDFKGFYFTGGKMYPPYGVYESSFVSNPLTKELGETRETALLAGYHNDWVEVSVAGFNGDVEKIDNENRIDDYVVSLSFTPRENITLGVSYISDIADTNADITGHQAAGTQMVDTIDGGAGFLKVSGGPVSLTTEYVASLEPFDVNDLDADGNGSGDRPQAWNVELAYEVTDKLTLATKYEGSKEFCVYDRGAAVVGTGFPRAQYGAVASYQLFENTTLSLEYLQGNYHEDFTPNREKKRDLVTAQLAIEF
jgi:hypothetical protein